MIEAWWRLLKRGQFTIGAALSAFMLIGLIAFAIYDSVSYVQASDQQVRGQTLAAELTGFLLATREADGTSLLENPEDFSAGQRPLRVVSLKRPFYTFLLNRANAKSFSAERALPDLPRPCIVEFEGAKSGQTSFPIQGCFAIVSEESGGRYVYFTLRYPVTAIRRHAPGQDLTQVDRVVILFQTEKKTSITLVFEPSTLASSRYPSQASRFAGLHEMSAFLSSNADRPLRQFNAQALERKDELGGDQKYVNIVGRIDAGVLDGGVIDAVKWPTDAIRSAQIGLQIFSGGDGSAPRLLGAISPGTSGNALVSLQKAYLSNVASDARLDVKRAPDGQLVWSSASLKLDPTPRAKGWIQAVSDWWAPKLVALFGKVPIPPPKIVPHRIGNSVGEVLASLTPAPTEISVAATRAFWWLSAALLLVLLLVVLGAIAFWQLFQVTRAAWAVTVSFAKAQSIDMHQHGRRRDEISTLGRVLNVLLARSKSRNAHLAQRVRLQQARLALSQDRLDAIGHEIRSPLQSLLSQTTDRPDLQTQLTRMRQAIETIFESASAEEGIRNLEVSCARTDVAKFLAAIVDNDDEQDLLYEGPTEATWVSIDPILFEQVVNHLIDNARRHRVGGTPVVIRLKNTEPAPEVEVFNRGPGIPPEDFENIFKYRYSSRLQPGNRGLGLYASRSYLLGMKALIKAANRLDGVVFNIQLERA